MPEIPASLPDFTKWPSFPFEGAMRVKHIQPPVAVEPPRKGEDVDECVACQAPDEAYIWVSERWRVRAMDRPTGLPVVLILETRSHLDLGDLPNLLAAELGVMTVRLERAIRSLDGVARVHVNRWGDGSAHMHLWFLARPYGFLQLRGTFLSLWDDILPAIPESQWLENLALIAAWLAEFGGRPLAEPPRFEWQAPSNLADQASAEAAAHRAKGLSVPTPRRELAVEETHVGRRSDDVDVAPGQTPSAGAVDGTGAGAVRSDALHVDGAGDDRPTVAGARGCDVGPADATGNQAPQADAARDVKLAGAAGDDAEAPEVSSRLAKLADTAGGDVEPADADRAAELTDALRRDAQPADVAGRDEQPSDVAPRDTGPAAVVGRDEQPPDVARPDAQPPEVARRDAQLEDVVGRDGQPADAVRREVRRADAGAGDAVRRER